MRFISFTFVVSKLDKSNDFNEVHPANISYIVSADVVLKFDKSIDFKF